MKVAVVIYTYNRIDDARINMELIRHTWPRQEILKHVLVVHAFNGHREWWPEPYLEDKLIYLANSGHFSGAEYLINEGVRCVLEDHKDIDYAIVVAADTWLTKPAYVVAVLERMKLGRQFVATSAWGNEDSSEILRVGMAVDLFVLDMKWARSSGIFPLRFHDFCERFSEILFYNDMAPMLEGVFALRFRQAVLRTEKIASEDLARDAVHMRICRLKEREPIHVMFKRRPWSTPYKKRIMCWPNIGLLTQHDSSDKQAELRKLIKDIALGQHGRHFVEAKDVGYFNNGFRESALERLN